MAATPDLARLRRALEGLNTIKGYGRVVRVTGLAIEATGLACEVGEVCTVATYGGGGRLLTEVVGFRNGSTLLMPLGEMRGIRPGSVVVARGTPFTVRVGEGLLGRVLDGLGRPIDGLGPPGCLERYFMSGEPIQPLSRAPIREPLETGVRAIDGLLTCGQGQRIGIFAGSGVGKSTLLGMIARNAKADVNVIALIGERGREVQEFIDRDLGPEGLARSVVVVSTSDQPALVRIRGAWVATAIAEYFRDQGKNVVFLMDSVTRVAMAQREVGLTVGEPPASKGYTPSVFALLPRLMERTGNSANGSITGFYTVLVESDDMTEPIADNSRSILDGHVVLTRELVMENHLPAIDVLQSASRVMGNVVGPEHLACAGRMRETMAAYRRARDLLEIGAYVQGTNPQVDRAVAMLAEINGFLRQQPGEHACLAETISWLVGAFGG
ncbi:MAG: FliI/YscN family ATPase [Dehalococcoidales bacterium]|nr:FliI/YscN family ATPase [Dehalococcoidales bacterium]